MISTSLFVYNFLQMIVLICDKTSLKAQIDEWCKRIQACFCAEGSYFEHLGLMQMFVYVFAIRKNQVISAKRLV